jgi:hypothetical protein
MFHRLNIKNIQNRQGVVPQYYGFYILRCAAFFDDRHKKAIKQPLKNNQADQNHRIHFIHPIKVWNIIGFQNRGHPHSKRDDDKNNQKYPE